MTDGQSAYHAARGTETPDLRVSFAYGVNPPILLNDEQYIETHREFDEEMTVPEIFGQMAKDILNVHDKANEWAHVQEEWRHSKRWLDEIGSHEGLAPISYYRTFTEKTLVTAIIALEEGEGLGDNLVEDLKEVVNRANAFKAENEQLLEARHKALTEFYMK